MLAPLLLLLGCEPDPWTRNDPELDFGIEDERMVEHLQLLHDWDIGDYPTGTELDGLLEDQVGPTAGARLYNYAASLFKHVRVDEALVDLGITYSVEEPDVLIVHPIVPGASAENTPPMITWFLGGARWGFPADYCVEEEDMCYVDSYASTYGAQYLASRRAYERCDSDTLGLGCVIFDSWAERSAEHIVLQWEPLQPADTE